MALPAQRLPNQVRVVGGGPAQVTGGVGLGGRGIPMRPAPIGGGPAPLTPAMGGDASGGGQWVKKGKRIIFVGGGGYYPYPYYPYPYAYPYYGYPGFFPTLGSSYWFGGWPYNYPFGYGYSYPGWTAPYPTPWYRWPYRSSGAVAV